MNKEREKSILEIAIKEKSVTVKDLARRLYSSEPSIRRDLCSLEKQGLLRRTHGGAVLNENALNEIKTPATDAFLAEIERKAIRKFINSIEHILRDKLSPYDTEEMLEAMRIFLEEQEGE